MSLNTEVKTRQMSIKSGADYKFIDNMIVNIKYFKSSVLEVKNVLFKGVFSPDICYIKYEKS